MKKALNAALLVAACALLLGGCSDDPTSPFGMPNPASVYCEEQGGRLEIRTEAEGQYGMCQFADGSACDEWAYFRGECQPGDHPEE